jgi:hypothetical protein
MRLIAKTPEVPDHFDSRLPGSAPAVNIRSNPNQPADNRNPR